MSSLRKSKSGNLSPHPPGQGDATEPQSQHAQNQPAQEGTTSQQTCGSVLESVEGQAAGTGGTAESAVREAPFEQPKGTDLAAAITIIAGSAMMVHGAANLELLRLYRLEIRDAPQPSVEATQFLQWIKNTQTIWYGAIEKILGSERMVQIMATIVATAGVARTIEIVYRSLRIVGEKIEYGIPSSSSTSRNVELPRLNTAQEVEAARLFKTVMRAGVQQIVVIARYIGAEELYKVAQTANPGVLLKLIRCTPPPFVIEIIQSAGDELIADIVARYIASARSIGATATAAAAIREISRNPQSAAVTVQLTQPSGSSAESQRSQATDPTRPISGSIERGDDTPGDGLQRTQPPQITRSNVLGDDSSLSNAEFLLQQLADCAITSEGLEHKQNSSNASDEDERGPNE